MNNVLNFDGEIDLEKYFKSFEALETLYPRITERKANLSMVGVNTRTYIHWRNEGLLGEMPVKGEPKLWVRLNLYEYVWLKTIKVLREFGIPIETIRELKDILYVNFLTAMETECEEYIEFLRTNSEATEEEILEQKKMIEFALEHKDEIAEEEKHLTTILGGLVHLILFASDEVSVIIYKTEKGFSYGCYTFKSIEAFSKHISEWLSVPHINIPLKSIIGEFMDEPKNESNLEVWGFIDKNEKKVLEAIRNKSFKEITIKKQTGETEKLLIEALFDGNIIEQKAKEIKRLLGLNQYSEITIKYRNDKHLYFKNKIRL